MILRNATYHLRMEFQDKIKWHMYKAAIAVMAEDDATEGHAARIVYASKILDGSASVKEYALGVITNTTIKTAIDSDPVPDFDDDLEFVVSSLFNAFAGV